LFEEEKQRQEIIYLKKTKKKKKTPHIDTHPWRGNIYIGVSKDGEWSTEHNLTTPAPWGFSLGFEHKPSFFAWGLRYTYKETTKKENDEAALESIGATIQIPIFRRWVGFYILGSLDFVSGKIEREIAYLDYSGDLVVGNVLFETDGTSYTLERGLGIDIPFRKPKPSSKTSFGSLFVEYLKLSQNIGLKFFENQNPEGGYIDPQSSFKLTGGYNQIRVGFKGCVN